MHPEKRQGKQYQYEKFYREASYRQKATNQDNFSKGKLNNYEEIVRKVVSSASVPGWYDKGGGNEMLKPEAKAEPAPMSQSEAHQAFVLLNNMIELYSLTLNKPENRVRKHTVDANYADGSLVISRLLQSLKAVAGD